MRKELFAAMMTVVICAVFAACGYSAAQEADSGAPPALEKGWNVISVPCTVRVGGLNRSVLRQLSYYTWDGEKYVRTTMLERGRGYIVDASQVVNTSSICETNRLSDPPAVTLVKGWNLVGNPYHESVPVSDVLGDAAAVVFEYRGNRFVELDESDRMKPWRGYWVYADAAATIDIIDACRLEVVALKANRSARELDVKINSVQIFSAKYICRDGKAESELDVSGELTWTMTDDTKGEMYSPAGFRGLAAGITEITPMYGNMLGDTFTIRVNDPQLEDCGELLLAFRESSYSDRPEARGHYYTVAGSADDEAGTQCSMCGDRLECRKDKKYWRQARRGFAVDAYCIAPGDGGRRDVTEKVEWSVPDGFFETADDGIFLSTHAGETEISAEYRGLKSLPLRVTICEDIVSAVEISMGPDMELCSDMGLEEFCGGAEYLAIAGNEYFINAAGAFMPDAGDSTFMYCGGTLPAAPLADKKDITGSVDWVSSDASALTVADGGELSAVGAGFATVTASFGSVAGVPVRVRVVAESDLISLTVEPADRVSTVIGGTVRLKATAQFAGGARDVTSEAVWTIETTGGEAPAMDGNGLFTAGLLPATGNISVSYKNKVAGPVPFEIVNPGPEACDELRLVFHAAEHSFAGGKARGVRLYSYSNEGSMAPGETCYTCGGTDITCRDFELNYMHSEYEPGTGFRVDAVCFKLSEAGADVFSFDVSAEVDWEYDATELEISGNSGFRFTESNQRGGYISARYGEIKSADRYAGALGKHELGLHPVNFIVTPNEGEAPCDAVDEASCTEAEYMLLAGETEQFYFTGNYIYRQEQTEFIACGNDETAGSGIYTEQRDVLPIVGWSMDREGIVEISEDGGVTALAPGTSMVSFTYKDSMTPGYGYVITFRVVYLDTALGLEVEPGGDLRLPADSGVSMKVIAKYFDREEEVWDNVEWVVEGDNQKLVSFDYETIRAGRELGTGKVKAKLGGVESEAINVEVYDPVLEDCESLKLVFAPSEYSVAKGPGFLYNTPEKGSVDDGAPAQCMACGDRAAPYCYSGAARNRAFWHEVGRDVEIRAVCVKKKTAFTPVGEVISRVNDVSDSVEWTIDNESLLAHAGGSHFSGLAEGRAVVSAKYRSMESGPHFVDLLEMDNGIVIKSETESLSCPAEASALCQGYSLVMAAGRRVELKALLDYSDLVVRGSRFISCNGGSDSLSDGSDATADVNWSVSDDTVMSGSGGGGFKALTAGAAEITASMPGFATGAFSVLVVDTVTPLALSFNRESPVEIGYGQATSVKVFAHYINRTEDVTERAQFSVECSRPDNTSVAISITAGIISGGIHSCAGGITAKLNGVSTDVLALNYLGIGIEDLNSITIEPSEKLTLFIKDTADLKVYGHSGSEKFDITEYVNWTFETSDGDDIISIDKGTVTAGIKPGTGNIFAEVGGLKSQAVDFEVETGTFVGISITPMEYILIKQGAEVDFKATAQYVTGSSCPVLWIASFYISHYPAYFQTWFPGCKVRNVDVTDETTWSLYSWGSGSAGTISGGTVTAGDAKNYGYVSGYYNGNYGWSDYFYVYVMEKEILVEPSNLRLAPGSSAMLYAITRELTSSYCYVYADSGDFECEYEEKDITTEGSWSVTTISGSAPGTVAGGEFFAPDNNWIGNLRIDYQGLSSPDILVEVAEFAWMALEIDSLSAYELPNCPERDCFYAMADQQNAKLSVKGRDDNYVYATLYDLTSEASWEVSDESIATIENGVIKPKKAGLIWARAFVGDARTAKAWIVIIDDQEREYLLSGLRSNNFKPVKPLQVGSSYYFYAQHYSIRKAAESCIGSRYCGSRKLSNGMYLANKDVTSSAEWISSNEAAAKFYNGKNALSSLSPGFVDVSAKYQGLKSNTTTIDVWNYQNMNFCEGEKNFGEWSDEHTRATLETSCKVYSTDENVYMRYAAYINFAAFLDNCLDLYVLDSNNEIVKTLREEGCTTESLGQGAAYSGTKVYETIGEWDQTDESGNKVAPGRYYAVARFYIMWEPIIRLPIDIIAGDAEVGMEYEE